MSELAGEIFKRDCENIKKYDAKLDYDGMLVVLVGEIYLRIEKTHEYPNKPPKISVFGPVGDVNRARTCDDRGFYALENLWSSKPWSNGMDIDAAVDRVAFLLHEQNCTSERENCTSRIEYREWEIESSWRRVMIRSSSCGDSRALEFKEFSMTSNIDGIFAAMQPLSGVIDDEDLIVMNHAIGFEPLDVVNIPTCYYTRLPHGDSTKRLMMPLVSTRNPATRICDQIEPLPWFISEEAFLHGIRTTPDGRNFTHAMPLIMDPKMVRPHNREAMVRLFKSVGLERIDLFLTMLTTTSMLVVDGAIEPNRATTTMIFQILQVMNSELSHGDIPASITKHVSTFIEDPRARTKARTRNLGHFTALVAFASPQERLHRVMPAIMREALTRNMLWLGQHDVDSKIVPLLNSSNIKGNEVAISSAAFDSGVKSMRLFVFITLLENIMTSDGKTKEAFLKENNGFPSVVDARRFNRGVEVLRDMKSWQEVLKALGLKVMDDVEIAGQVSIAWKNSKSLGYHSDTTDFKKIQASGVSTILKRGESYKGGIDKGTKSIDICDTWGWTYGVVRYLDTTVFLTDARGNVIDYMDYTKRTLLKIGTHSGDIMGPHSGQHLVNIRLSACQQGVEYIYVVLSAFADSTLEDIKQPSVVVSSEGNELCRYSSSLSSLDKKKQALVLCRFERAKAGGWTVVAIGKTCMGNASNYTGIAAEIVGFHPTP